MTTVVLGDDDVLLREGIASLLERSGFDVLGQAADGTELVALVQSTEPELAIVDIRMPPTFTTEGLDAARTLREQFPRMALLILSAHVEVDHAMELVSTGSSVGYLLKSRVNVLDDFLDTLLERITHGASVVDPGVVQELVGAKRRNDPLAALTPRELEVLELMAEGYSNSGIGRRLFVAEGTVEKHVRSILAKLQFEETDDDHRRVLAVITFLEAR